MRPTCLEVDLAALIANYHAARRLTGDLPLLAVVKGNGYGHGLVEVSRALADAGAALLGVATVEEGRRLREAGIATPILLMGGYLAGDAPDIVAARITPTVFTAEQVTPLAGAARTAGIALPVHVKVDTGMGRIGFAPEAAPEAIRRVAETPGLSVEGVFTHFAEADLADSPAADRQLEQLEKVHAELGALAGSIRYWHAANSAAVMRAVAVGGEGRFAPTLCRPGLMLYGIPPAAGFPASGPLRPVAVWKARLIQVKAVPAGTSISYGRTFVTDRPARIGTLPVGYADGYRRALSNGGPVLVRGHRVPVVGRVCMDMTMVDLTDLPDDVAAGEEAVLMGRQGEGEITATELGALCDTISYDILCGISERVPRRYHGSGAGAD